ncbi:ABC transporter ATP-binding protein [Rothia sp. ZJ932]|uniref:ABC transporter ATP-binding protein n=1 Tax=Rothia sp. ZJ932 TaxID=2810516 RepID=UPI001967F74D|nr:ATP-binding cassette domain-containing protein [Rothia sp. ZJ932]QRZ61664.1 ATP-binding cassette domain-containing protein [Rothia sp. ZJ932]
MATITFENVTCTYPGALRPAVDNLNLKVADGEFLVLVGPSGCGKSTTLRMLAGLENITSGRILINGADITHVAPKNRDVAMVFQNYALYPHLTVRGNMAFPLVVAKQPRDLIQRAVEETAAKLDLTDYLDRKPEELSGGQRQRVAMGRAIVRQPQAFLMDEPLSHLDAQLRQHTRAHISEVTGQLGITTLYVTHDQIEAMTMGDRVAVLHQGVLQQLDTPTRIYDHPANTFVASFIGSPSINFFRCPVTGEGASLGSFVLPLPQTNTEQGNAGCVLLGIRPEHLELTDEGKGIAGRVETIEELGADAYAYIRTDEVELAGYGADLQQCVAVRVPARTLTRDSNIWIKPSGAVHFFDADTGKNLQV